MSIGTPEELDGFKAAGRVGARDPRDAGQRRISVNDKAVRGIPGPRRLRDGDLVKLDVTAELDGFYADACVSVPVDRPQRATIALTAAVRAALTLALAVARAGTPINEIGRAVQQTVEPRGYAVCLS